MQRTASTLFATLFAAGAAFCVALYAAPEAQSATYSQTVDNSTSGRFSASSKWIKSDYSSQRYGKNYRVLKKPGSTSTFAKYKVKTPTRGYYKISARWPANSGYNDRTKYRIKTASGWKIKEVNQRKNGGKWQTLGTYKLRAGDFQRIKVSSNSSGQGYIIADAVKIQRVPAPSTTSNSTTGSNIVSFARKQIGDRYVYGATGPDAFDCSGLTQFVYKKVANKSIPHSASSQYKYGRSVSRSDLKPGDLIFGNAGGSGIQHVGIYAGKNSSGQRQMIHAGNEQTDVEITTYESWYNVIGYRRLL